MTTARDLSAALQRQLNFFRPRAAWVAPCKRGHEESVCVVQDIELSTPHGRICLGVPFLYSIEADWTVRPYTFADVLGAPSAIPLLPAQRANEAGIGTACLYQREVGVYGAPGEMVLRFPSSWLAHFSIPRLPPRPEHLDTARRHRPFVPDLTALCASELGVLRAAIVRWLPPKYPLNEDPRRAATAAYRMVLPHTLTTEMAASPVAMWEPMLALRSLLNESVPADEAETICSHLSRVLSSRPAQSKRVLEDLHKDLVLLLREEGTPAPRGRPRQSPVRAADAHVTPPWLVSPTKA